MADILAGKLLYWGDGYNDKPGIRPVMPVLSDWDMSPAKDYSKMIKKWNTIDSYKTKDSILQTLSLPDIKLATTPEFIRRINESTINLPEISGERPAVWLYIHGPSHEWALKASREGDTDMINGKVCYEVPFGVLEVGKDEIPGAAGERYVTDCREVHPRGIENWIGASDDRIGVTLWKNRIQD